MPAPPVGRAGRRRPPLGGIAVVSLVAGLALWAVLGARGDRPQPPTGDRVVAVGGASVTVPPDWRPARRPGDVVPGLAEPAVVLDPFTGMSIHAVVVRSPRGVPRALTDLTGPLGSGRPAQLAGLAALAYDERPLPGDRIAELTVARSPSGVLIVACIARSDSWPLAAGCAEQVGPG